MKFKLTLNKTYEIDTDDSKSGWEDTMVMLKEILVNDVGVSPGDTANSGQIKEAIEKLLEEDLDYVVDLDINETDFQVEVGADQTVEVPEDEEEEDEDNAA